jgi:Na+/proline symporter
MAPVFRRCRRTTVAQIVEDRYGAGVAVVYTLFAVTFFVLNTGVMLKGAGKVISGATGGGVSVNAVIFAMTVTFIAYSFVGGLVAAAWTDFFQSFLILALSFLLLPLGWGHAGGMSGIKAKVHDPDFFQLFTLSAAKVTPFIILMLTLNGLIGIMAQPHMVGAVGTGKDESACRVGFTYGNFIKRFCTIGWALVGLMVLALPLSAEHLALLKEDPENAFGVASQRLLFPGLLGLLIASVLAANMSTCSAFMVDSGALFTRGFYDRFIAPGRTDKHYLWAGRISGFVITLLGVGVALLFVESVLNWFLLTETLATYFGISILGGIIWRRANRWGALASLFVALGARWWLHHRAGVKFSDFDAVLFGWSLLAGAGALVVVSLITPREGEAARELFQRLDTPAHWDDRPGSEDAAAEDASDRGEQLILPNLLHLRRAARGRPFFKAYRQDLMGFAVAWGVVAAMIAVAWAILQLG